jgi:phosphopantothenoylcysteine synthetase/decarboxylase
MTASLHHVLVTAGPTREAVDPVRFLSNRSSGKMGFAIAQAAAAAGHRVTLIAGPAHLPTPEGVTRIDVETAEEMYQAVAAALCDGLPPIDIAILTAAVADYRPKAVVMQKIKKHQSPLTLELEPTRDILGSLRSPLGFSGTLVGFAAETENVLEHAHAKLVRKGCDFMVANDVSRPGVGFDADENEVTLVFPHAPPRPLARGSKLEIARVIVGEALVRAGTADQADR